MKNSTIHKGDQYAIPVRINFNGAPLLPDDCDDVAIKIWNELKTLSKEEITYDSENKVYEYPVDKEETRKWPSPIALQIGVKWGEDYKYSDVEMLYPKESIITEDW